MFIDSHCHLQLFDVATSKLNVAELMVEAKQAKIKHILCVATHLNQYPKLQQLNNEYPHLNLAIGLHPTEQIAEEPTVTDYLAYLQNPKVIAVGETGLDYYRLAGDPLLQQQRFRTQIQAAICSNKPLIIHSREAKQDTLAILQEERADKVGGIFHCFTEDLAFAKQVLAMNFVISISGIVTFAKAETIKTVAKLIPLEQLLVETDAPWLAPVPFRGKVNKPSYVKYIVEYIAKLRNIEVTKLCLAIEQNYYRIFPQLQK